MPILLESPVGSCANVFEFVNISKPIPGGPAIPVGPVRPVIPCNPVGPVSPFNPVTP